MNIYTIYSHDFIFSIFHSVKKRKVGVDEAMGGMKGVTTHGVMV